jgi:hypothetical protein
MTLDVFWQRIEIAIGNWSNCDICLVQEYAKETNTERMCDRVDDCADGLMMLHKKLHKKLQEEERQKMECVSDGKNYRENS